VRVFLHDRRTAAASVFLIHAAFQAQISSVPERSAAHYGVTGSVSQNIRVHSASQYIHAD
jgi:hypothetical protein